MTAVVADGIRDIEGEIVTSFDSRYAQELTVLRLAQMLLKVTMERRTSGEVLDVFASVQTEAVKHIEFGILHDVEIAVVQESSRS